MLLPESLDLRAAARALGGRKAEDRLACVVHRVGERSRRNREAERWGGFVPVNAKELERLLGSRYASKALRVLTCAGVLERGAGYQAGRFSRGYRLALPHRDAPVKPMPLRDAALAAKLSQEDSTANAEAAARCPVLAAVLQNLRRATLPRGICEEIGQRRDLTDRQRAAWAASAAELQAGRVWLRVGEQTGRVFHTLTNLPKELRRRVTFGDVEAAEVDMRNAQPFFLLAFYPPGPDAAAEREAFAQTVGAGRFYEHLRDALAVPDGERWADLRDPRTRGAFKEAVMAQALFSDLRERGKSKPLFAALAKLFPQLSAKLAEVRRRPGGGSVSAVALQRAEVALVLGRVLPRVLRELPEAYAVPIHDALLCAETYAERVAQVFREEAAAAYGVTPTVTVTHGAY